MAVILTIDAIETGPSGLSVTFTLNGQRQGIRWATEENARQYFRADALTRDDFLRLVWQIKQARGLTVQQLVGRTLTVDLQSNAVVTVT